MEVIGEELSSYQVLCVFTTYYAYLEWLLSLFCDFLRKGASESISIKIIEGGTNLLKLGVPLLITELSNE